MLTYLRLLGTGLGLVLMGTGCGAAPTTQEPAAGRASQAAGRPNQAAGRPNQAAATGRLAAETDPDAVAARICALLDTTSAGGPRAADARLGLQAGAAVRAFYGPAGVPAWQGRPAPADSLGADARATLALLARAADYGLRPADYGLARLQSLRDSLGRPATTAALTAAQIAAQTARQARFEVYLTDAALTFGGDQRRGRLRRYARPPAGPAAGADSPAGLHAALVRHAVPAALLAGQPPNREYRLLQQALARYLAQGLTRPAAPDSAAPHEARYELAALNLERWRWDALPAPAEYVLINLPAAELYVVAHDSVLLRHRVIVGAAATPTPTLSSAITHFTLAPDWLVPRSIAVRELLPRLRHDAGYLARNNYALYDAAGQPLDPARIAWAGVTARNFAYFIRQSAGCENALGNVVFRFANPYSVYLHDTPARQLFARPGRALSHGCIRLAEPFGLAAYLLRREGRPALLPTDEACARLARPRDVRLARPLPLFVRYATCTAENGRLRGWPDVYGRDEVIRRELFGPRP